jgi:tetratricopeptide (TPR) repeat protein
VAVDVPDATTDRAGPRWLAGPAPDLLLGAGGAYLISVPLLLLAASGAARWPLLIVWALEVLVNGPHYGATLLRVYETRDERRKYAFFAVWATLLLAALFAVGAHEALVGSLLVTLYFSWSPWHFAGQNYGVAVMFLRRSGVVVAPGTRRLLYASFALSFALTFLALHAEGSSSLPAPTRGSPEQAPELLRLGIPGVLAHALMAACAAAYLGCLAAAALRLRREATLRQLLPVASLALTQALWFSLPAVAHLTGSWSLRNLAFAAVWISAAHSLQYLWVTSHYAKRRAPRTKLPSYLLRATLAGNGVFVIPAILFAPALLGRVTWDAGLATLVFALVNVHHFVLDGAIWKLRDGAIARVLLRSEPEATPAPPRSSRISPLAAALWAACAFSLAVAVAELGRQEAEQAGDVPLARALVEGLSRVGRDHELARIRIGRALLRQQDWAGARREFERSLAARPTVAAWGGLGRALAGAGDLRGAAEAYRAGLALAPDDAALLRSAGFAYLALGEPERAAPLLERALSREPDHAATRSALERARRAPTP